MQEKSLSVVGGAALIALAARCVIVPVDVTFDARSHVSMGSDYALIHDAARRLIEESFWKKSGNVLETQPGSLIVTELSDKARSAKHIAIR